MGTDIRYTDEFKQEAMNQVVKHGYSVLGVSSRLGMAKQLVFNNLHQLSLIDHIFK